MMVLHYLGLDHAGHLGGVQPPPMAIVGAAVPKLCVCRVRAKREQLQNLFKNFNLPETGLDFLICVIFARQRVKFSGRRAGPDGVALPRFGPRGAPGRRALPHDGQPQTLTLNPKP